MLVGWASGMGEGAITATLELRYRCGWARWESQWSHVAQGKMLRTEGMGHVGEGPPPAWATLVNATGVVTETHPP